MTAPLCADWEQETRSRQAYYLHQWLLLPVLNLRTPWLPLQDPPEYFDRPGGFLVFTPDVPKAMLEAAVPPPGQQRLYLNGTVGHFDLMHHQLRQVGAPALWVSR